jgi:BirA family biotin operon repressor/biotin-[acetyl-CoA-carboxylase] ligase
MSVKSELLELFITEKGTYFSGEHIAERLHCSRTAVWKAVQQLKEEGYEITAVQNRGYALSEESDVLSREEILHYLDKPYPLTVLQEVTSTNDVLKAMANTQHASEGTTIVSDYQTGGKGRLGRSFFSPKGTGLYVSMLLRPQDTVSNSLTLTAKAAVAVYRAVKTVCNVEIGIKWVNDLYLGHRKVCGILSEGQASMESGHLDFVIAGIGINIYEPEGGFPEEIRQRAGSIMGQRTKEHQINRNRLAAEVIREFYQLAAEPGLTSDYAKHNIVPGHEITVIDGDRRRPAKALSILPDGRLEIQEADGSRNALVFGEVSVRLRDGNQTIER